MTRVELISRDAISQLAKIEPEMQRNQGMMRRCEILLVARMAQTADLFISLGCGPHGCDMMEARYIKPTLQIAGFERQPAQLDFSKHNIEYHQTDIFDPATVEQIKQLIQLPGRCLVYTDNGNKRKELQLVAPLLKSGDVVGAHDYPNEVPEAWAAAFMQQDFDVCQDAESWIEMHLCWQRFWVRH